MCVVITPSSPNSVPDASDPGPKQRRRLVYDVWMQPCLLCAPATFAESETKSTYTCFRPEVHPQVEALSPTVYNTAKELQHQTSQTILPGA